MSFEAVELGFLEMAELDGLGTEGTSWLEAGRVDLGELGISVKSWNSSAANKIVELTKSLLLDQGC